MIITYPFAIPYTKGKQQRVVPDSVYSSSEVLSGSYPMGKNRFWHGGVHLHPADRATPIRAIADGEVVAYRFDETDATDAFFDKAAYSRSFVLLKHVAELGQTALGTTKLEFYSLYMHLQAWGQVKGKTGAQAVNFLKKLVPAQPRKGKDGSPLLDKKNRPIMSKAYTEVVAPVADGACQSGSGSPRVRRGDILGYVGSIPDNLTTPSRGIHFEIFFADPSFLGNEKKNIWGRCTLSSDLRVVEDLLTKQALTVDPAKPISVDNTASTNGYWNIKHEKRTYWVSHEQIVPKEVDVPDPKNKKNTIKATKYFATGPSLSTYKKNPEKVESILKKGTSIVPWMEPLLKAGEFQELTVEGKTWVQVFTPDDGELFWAEKKSITFTSDADWPNFQKLEEHGEFSSDGFIDDAGLKAILDAYEKDAAGKAAQGEKLRNIITKHPTEWSSQDIAKRFDRVMRDDYGPSKLTADQFSKLTAHITRLAFWEQVPGLPSAKGVWHAHPIRFIEHLAKCLWLSADELELIYPDKKDASDPAYHGTPDDVREKYRYDLNRCCYRYGVNSRLRQAHFYGQGAVECMSLNLMLENDPGTKYDGRSDLGNIQPGDGPKFKGRGFKQLTGRYNYAFYWEFKGWIKEGQDYDQYWWTDKKKRYPKIDNPEILISNTFYCIDAGTWYIAKHRPDTLAAMDSDDVKKVTKAINGGEIGLSERTELTELIRKILL